MYYTKNNKKSSPSNSMICSSGVFDNLIVKTPDGNFPLIQLGQVVQKSAQLLTINMAPSPQVRKETGLDSNFIFKKKKK